MTAPRLPRDRYWPEPEHPMVIRQRELLQRERALIQRTADILADLQRSRLRRRLDYWRALLFDLWEWMTRSGREVNEPYE